MIRVLLFSMIIILGVVCLAWGQSTKDVYKAVNKAYLSASGSPRKDFDNAVVDARNEFDLFKDSQAAKKNPEFTKHIEAALMAIREAQFASDPRFQDANRWKQNMDKAEKELASAKKYLK
jgi:hypothetical protein